MCENQFFTFHLNLISIMLSADMSQGFCNNFIEKLICREQDLQEEDTVLRVYRPSPLAKFIQRNS